MKTALDEMLTILYNTFRCVDGLSPNGKATDSDSVIFKVRILVAQLLIPQMKVCGILLVYPREFMIQ